MITLNFYVSHIEPRFADRAGKAPGYYVTQVEQDWDAGMFPRDLFREHIAGPFSEREYATMLADQYMHVYRNRGAANRVQIAIDLLWESARDQHGDPLAESVEHAHATIY